MSIVLDVVLALVLIGFTVRGLRRGFAGSVGALAGLAAGVVAAVLLAVPIGGLAPAGTPRQVATIAAAVVLPLAGLLIGSGIGGAVGRALRRTPLGPVDRALGAGTQLVVAAFAIALVAALAPALSVPDAAQAESGSVVLGAIRTATPAPVEQAITVVREAVVTGRAPSVGAERLPALAAGSPTIR